MRINAAAENDFVAFAQLDHFLHRHALEMLCAGLLGAGGVDGIERLADLGFVLQIQLHPAHVRLVCDGFGIELQHRWVTDFPGQFGRLIFRLRYLRVIRWDFVAGEQFLGFGFCENRAAGFLDRFNQHLGFGATRGEVVRISGRHRRFIQCPEIF